MYGKLATQEQIDAAINFVVEHQAELEALIYNMGIPPAPEPSGNNETQTPPEPPIWQ
jgi:hypothetical protein